LALAQRNHERTKEAAEKGALPRRSADETEDAYLAARTTLLNVQRTLTEEQDKLNSLRAEAASRPLQLDRRTSELRRQLGDVDQRIADAGGAGSEVFVAAADGIVSSISVQVGEYVVAGQNLASITPPGATLRAALLVPTRVAGFVESDMEVTLRYEAFPYQKYGSFSGRVAAIDRLPLAPGEARFPVDVKEPVHVVKVALNEQTIVAGAKDIPLQPGMTLRGDIAQERKRIIDWLLDPILNLVHQ
jgi:membrane fusion protein